MEETNISNCFICSGPLDCPKNLLDENCKKLRDLLIQLLGFQVDIQGGIFTICQTCEGKLVWLDEFKELCLNSLERFKIVECKKEIADSHEHESISPIEVENERIRRSSRGGSPRVSKYTENLLKNPPVGNIVNLNEDLDYENDFPSSSISDNETSDSTPKHPKTRKKSINRVKKKFQNRKCSSLYLESDVLNAIAECESYMTDMKYRKCLHCDYEAPNAKSMWIHMPLKHKKEYKSWCKHCNIQTENLQDHKNSALCYEERCKFCSKPYPNKNVLLLHLRTHCENNLIEETKKKTRSQYTKEQVLQAITHSTKYMTDMSNRTCLHCSYVAPRAKTLAVHFKRRHRDSYDTWCSRCNLQTDHLKTHLNITRCYESICSLCDKKYNRINRLTIHLKSHCHASFKKGIGNNDWDDEDDDDDDDDNDDFSYFDENKADNIADDESSVSLPLDSINNDNTVKKTILNNRPIRKTALNNRRTTQISRHNNPYTICPICKKKVRSIRSHNITKHKTIKVRVNSIKGLHNKLCTVCGKLFKNNQLLKIHMRKHNGLGEKCFKCSFCEKQFPNKCYLRDHERRHTGEKPFVCHICGRGFVSNGEQKCHMKIHEGGPVQCTICNKEFPRPGVLALHMKRHTGENPFNCIECDMSYHRASLLKLHMRSHSNERPFKCSFCDKYFSCKSTLRKHERIHKGIKPYKCSVCSFSCTQAHGLSSHMKQHPEDPPQPDRPYKCQFCYRQFDTNAMLMSHNNNQHPEQAARKE